MKSRYLWVMALLCVCAFSLSQLVGGCEPPTQPADSGVTEPPPSRPDVPPTERTTPPETKADTKPDSVSPHTLSGDYSKYTPEECGQCHKQHYEDWRGSMHAYASKDPVFTAMLKKGILETKGKLDQFCIQCHAPTASKLGLTPVLITPQGNHEIKLDTSNHLISHGVQCITCHTTKSVEATLNAKFTSNTKTIYGPTGSAAANKAHHTTKSTLLTQSRVCGSCHNVVNPKGALLENTFSEWYASDFNGDTPQTTKRCQDCHMPTFQGKIVDGGRTTTLHRHSFVGVDQALIKNFPHKAQQAAWVKQLLQSCAEIRVEKKEDVEGKVAILVYVKNINNGHNLPSGSTADRQVWVHLQIKDQQGKLLFESGMLDPNGDLMDRIPGHSTTPNGDPYLLMFSQFLFDENGKHVNFPWQAKTTKDKLLAPGQTAWREYLIEKSKLAGKTITINARLRYRTFPPFLIRKLIEGGFMKKDELEPIPIIDMVKTSAQYFVR